MIVTIQGDINISLHANPTDGDIIYATLLDNNQAGTNTNSGKRPVAIGIATSINGNKVTIDTANFPSITLTHDHYLFFSKDRRVNMSGILGYYASVEYRNYSRKKAEIFATGTEYAPSSK